MAGAHEGCVCAFNTRVRLTATLAVGRRSSCRVYWEAHQGAVYMNQGVSFLVRHLDIARKEAHVVPFLGPYYTNLRDHNDVNVVARSATTASGLVHFGPVQVRHACLLLRFARQMIAPPTTLLLMSRITCRSS